MTQKGERSQSSWAETIIGSERGGQTAALPYSTVETCRSYDINPLEYITDILA